MKFTDIFIKRPVLATVISLLILLFGLRATFDLPVRQFPEITQTVIKVITAYPGASADLMQGFISSPVQKAIASADGIDYITADSSDGVSTISAYILLDFDPDKAFTSIMSKVAEVRGELPKESEQPIIQKITGSQIALMYISFNSEQMSPQQITDYVSRVVQPEIETITGVSAASILGNLDFAMRIWMDPDKMAALGITTTDITKALKQKNFQSSAGSTKGEFVAYNLTAQTALDDVEDFKNIIIRRDQETLLRLKDVTRVELGSRYYDASVTFDGKPAVFMGINAAPTANPLTVINKIRAVLPALEKNYPPSLQSTIVYDATTYIRSSLSEVATTIIEASLIVVLVIFLFFGSLRTVIIPIITIPLSLIGVCSLMLMLGYSINLLTLLAMVMAIGLVVDDAIVVVENIHRHIEEGMTSLEAALKGAREIAAPVITMTITLAAVYAPIGFVGGVTGALFTEFAFTLAAAVFISGIIALSLSPMMCSKLLTAESSKHRFVHYLDEKFAQLQNFYQKYLHSSLDYRPVTAVFAILILFGCYFLYTSTAKELAPAEDQSALFVSATAPQYANIDYVTAFSKKISDIFKEIDEEQYHFVVNGEGAVNNIIAGLILKPWDQRTRSEEEIKNELQPKLQGIAGLNSVIFPLPSLPTGEQGLPVQFVLTTTQDHKFLYQAMKKVEAAAQKSGLFMFVDSSLKFNKAEFQLEIDREKAASLDIDMADIGITLATALGGSAVNRFKLQGRSYKVIPQLERKFRTNPEQLERLYLRSQGEQLIPLSTITTLKQTIRPNRLSQFQQLNSATIQGMMMPGLSLSAGLDFLQKTADKTLPREITNDYAGASRTFMQESQKLMYTFFFALIIIYLVLAAQFESFVDPWIILISVPLAIFGALLPLNLGFASVNIYTQVGLITLIGLISKHGILMVEFANKQQAAGKSVREAIEAAASTRLRPILMTTAAMVLGVMPLVLASGAGAVSRNNIGLVIALGMAIGTIFTLFVVPAMYIMRKFAMSVGLLTLLTAFVATSV